MKRTVLPILAIALAATFTAMFGITGCAQPTSPKDCPIQNGPNTCKPS